MVRSQVSKDAQSKRQAYFCDIMNVKNSFSGVVSTVDRLIRKSNITKVISLDMTMRSLFQM